MHKKNSFANEIPTFPDMPKCSEWVDIGIIYRIHFEYKQLFFIGARKLDENNLAQRDIDRIILGLKKIEKKSNILNDFATSFAMRGVWSNLSILHVNGYYYFKSVIETYIDAIDNKRLRTKKQVKKKIKEIKMKTDDLHALVEDDFLLSQYWVSDKVKENINSVISGGNIINTQFCMPSTFDQLLLCFSHSVEYLVGRTLFYKGDMEPVFPSDSRYFIAVLVRDFYRDGMSKRKFEELVADTASCLFDRKGIDDREVRRVVELMKKK